jgi:hypothetical protein
MAEDGLSGLVGRLEKAGLYVGGQTRHLDDSVEVKLRNTPDTSGEPERSFFGTDRDDACPPTL